MSNEQSGDDGEQAARSLPPHGSITYKVLGELTASDGVGVLGHNTAGSGTAIGVQGATDSPNGYGLHTPDDAKIGGVLEAATLAGSLTGGKSLTDLAGNNLSINSGSLDAIGSQPSVSDDGTTVVSGAGDINFASGIAASDDGDGTASASIPSGAITTSMIADGTIGTADLGQNGASSGDSFVWDGSSWTTDSVASGSKPSVSDDGTTVVSGASDINFGSGLAASDDGDGTVTIDGGGNWNDTDGDNLLEPNSGFTGIDFSAISGSKIVADTAELSYLGGSLTGDTTVDSLAGDGLTIAGGALALGPTSVQTHTASTFGESDVSVTHTKTTLTNNAIELGPDVSRPADNTDGTIEQKTGLEFEPKVDLSEITATISSNTSGETTVYIYNGSGTQLTSEPSPGAGNSVTLTTSLAAGTKYWVLIDDGGNTYWSGNYDNPSFPYTSSMVNITDSGYLSSSGSFITFSAAHSISKLEANQWLSGSATVEFSRPSSVRHWRTASFQDELDGETVEVYVETSSDSGSTWSDWQSKPIGPGTDMSAIPAGDHVRFRVELSRADTANNPRLTLLSRQYNP